MIIEHSIDEIKQAMVTHNQDDNRHFEEFNHRLTTIVEQLALLHDASIRKEEIQKATLAEVRKTNGRVTSLEGVAVELTKNHAVLYNIVSKQDGDYQKYVLQQEKLKAGESDVYATKVELSPIKMIVYGMVGIILSSVLIALIALVVIRTQ